MTLQADRRTFLRGGIAAAGALLVPIEFARAAGAAGAPAPIFQPNAFIRIGKDSAITVFLPKSEMGQGINTSIPMILAEELDADLDGVKIEFCEPGKADGLSQVTAASQTTQTTTAPLRLAAAKTRALLVQAAASQWGVAPTDCTTENGTVLHVPTKKALRYGDLVAAAAKLPIPESATPKAAGDYKLVGKPRRRLDGPGKVKGTALFGIDAMPPGVKFAGVNACPVFGGKLVSVDEAPALKVPGVIKVVKFDNAVAVIGDHTGAVRAGLQAIDPKWDFGDAVKVSQADIDAALDKASQSPGAVAKLKGDPDAAIAGAAKKVEAVYHMPYLAHATMEPVNCTAWVKGDSCELWMGHQSPVAARDAAAKAAGVTPEKVTFHNHLLGGGFGRKVELDMINQAVALAKTVDFPVKLIWSREEDTQHDWYRPHYLDRLAAGLDADGKPVGWTHRITGSSLMGRFAPAFLEKMKGVDMDAIEGSETSYALPAQRVEFQRCESVVPTGFWRGVGTAHNSFVVESFIDECAHAAGKDPAAYRKDLTEEPRLKAAIALACDKAGWGKPLPKGRGLGISAQSSWHTLMAIVVDAEVTPDGSVKVHRVVCAVDCGQAINPLAVKAQCEGGINFGLTAALMGEITIAEGRVEQSNFNDYPAIRINESPAIEVYHIESAAPSGGLGEAPTAAVAPALANAVFAACGKRVRTLPLSRADLKSA